MSDRPHFGIDFVSHVSAQAASGEHLSLHTNKNPAQHIRLLDGILGFIGSSVYFRLLIST